MSPQFQSNKKRLSAKQTGAWIGGVFLIVIGLLIFANQVIELPGNGSLFMPLLALLFILWGLVSREGGLLIPGGVLGGISAGFYLMAGPYANLEGTGQPGVFLLGFAGGWVLITLLSIFTGEIQWWALVPGVILALIGGGLLAGGMWLEVLGWVNRLWPVALILLGLWIILKRRR